ncbi:MAG TPA: tripartite tricarboxylate transporter substrate-binding protein [Candidatus Limnocylindria bacterium]|nr:tripartite tricarboxylate transporter substrate-binding protein [Candidatus Limnocylindria bacterium]
MGRPSVLAVLALVIAACGGAAGPGAPTSAPTAAATENVAAFYQGKTVRIIVGLEAGGGFDTTARVLSRHIGKYIPGNPTVVVENMPGAGSRLAANYLYKVAQPDGLTFGVFNELQVLQQALGAADIEFDAKKFGWLGSVFSATIVCIARKDSGFTKIQDVMSGSKQFIVGSTGPGSNTGDFPQVLRTALGANIKIVSGYNGTAGISRAVDSGEVHGGCWTWESMSVTQGKNIQDGTMVPLVQQGDDKVVQNVPMAADVAKDAAGKAMVLAITTPTSISKSFTAPPGVPAARLAALREAFTKAWADPALKEEAVKAKIDINPKNADAVQKTVDTLLGFDKATMEALKAALALK